MSSGVDDYDFWPRLGRTAIYIVVVMSAAILPPALALFALWRLL